MRLRLGASMWVAGVLPAIVGTAACSSSLTPSDGAVVYSPCAEGTRVGDFGLSTSPLGDSGTSSFGGAVLDHPLAFNYRRAVVSDGDCTLMERPPQIPCTPACSGSDTCYPDGTCAPASISHSVGTVTLTGLASGRLSIDPFMGDYKFYENDPGDLPYPLAAPGATISLHASGGDYAPFTLAGRAVTVLPRPTGTLTVTRDQPLALGWNANAPASPTVPPATRLMVSIHLGDDGKLDGGGVPGAGYVVCTFPDTGSGVVPAALINRLIDQGVGAAPHLYMERRTATSTQIAPGCVEFAVVAPTDQAIVVTP